MSGLAGLGFSVTCDPCTPMPSGSGKLLVAYDVDIDGDKGAERLGQLSLRMQRIRPPVGRDVTAFWEAAGRVRDWARFEVVRLHTGAGAGFRWAARRIAPQPERRG